MQTTTGVRYFVFQLITESTRKYFQPASICFQQVRRPLIIAQRPVYHFSRNTLVPQRKFNTNYFILIGMEKKNLVGLFCFLFVVYHKKPGRVIKAEPIKIKVLELIDMLIMQWVFCFLFFFLLNSSQWIMVCHFKQLRVLMRNSLLADLYFFVFLQKNPLQKPCYL